MITAPLPYPMHMPRSAQQADYALPTNTFLTRGEHAWVGSIVERNTGRTTETFTALNYGVPWANIDNHSYLVAPGGSFS